MWNTECDALSLFNFSYKTKKCAKTSSAVASVVKPSALMSSSTRFPLGDVILAKRQATTRKGYVVSSFVDTRSFYRSLP